MLHTSFNLQIALESAPDRSPARKWITAEGTAGNTNDGYEISITENCPDCIFTIYGEDKNTGEQVMNLDVIGLRWVYRGVGEITFYLTLNIVSGETIQASVH